MPNWEIVPGLLSIIKVLLLGRSLFPDQNWEQCERIMKLLNPERAIVETEKIAGYCLNPEHPQGKHKARVFQSAQT
ncbi:MAG: hypothetical protein KME32_26170 [Mojavia pulchra JT2-VF2]|uniref:DUF6883 domain-containing protein n=1 Tax=Mojavia pulchra JT2-VF2 TaxID=287848 RepID=A0A951Q4E5_9NOST|nr:hypothetical protein [Mojavia pulchra JT2-VF2]